MPSLLLDDDTLYFLGVNSDLLSCFDAKNGTPHYEPQRLPELSYVHSSSVGSAGHVYITSREGVTVVLRHGPLEMLDDVKRVKDQNGIRKGVTNDFDVGTPHITAHAHNLVLQGFAVFLKERFLGDKYTSIFPSFLSSRSIR